MGFTFRLEIIMVAHRYLNFLAFAVFGLFMAMSLQSKAQKISADWVPNKIKLNFAHSVPRTPVKWVKTGKSYLAEFTKKESEYIWQYSLKGDLMAKMSPATPADMSPQAKNYLKRNYPESRIKAVFKVINRDKKKWYEVELASQHSLDLVKISPTAQMVTVHSRHRGKVVALAGSVQPTVPAKVKDGNQNPSEHGSHVYVNEDLSEKAWLVKELEEDMVDADRNAEDDMMDEFDDFMLGDDMDLEMDMYGDLGDDDLDMDLDIDLEDDDDDLLGID